MVIRASSIGGIPFGDNAGRPANPSTGQPYFNGQENRLELFTNIGGGSWQNIVAETPGVVSVSFTPGAVGAGTINVTGTNFTSGAIVSVIGSNGVEVNAISTTVNSIVSVTASVSGLSYLNDPYDVKVTNPSNLYGILTDAFNVSQSPVWQTASGSLGTFAEQVSITLSALSATDPEGVSVTYSVASGSFLPTGLTLNSQTGVISGTLPNAPADTTYTFTINASDGLNIVPRSFSISSAHPSYSGGTLITSDGTYFYRLFTDSTTFNVSNAQGTVEALILGGGGGGGASFGGGGGAGALLHVPSVTLQPGSYTITVGDGAPQNTAADSVQGLDGSNSSAFGFVALGGGGGGSYNNNYSGRPGGCGGGAGSSETSGTMTGGATSQQSVSGATIYANRGGNSFGRNPYIGTGGGGTGAQGQDITGGTTAGNGGDGTNAFSSWLSVVSSSMPSAWQSATSGGRIGGGGAGASYQYSNGSTPGQPGSGGGGTSTGGQSVRGGNAVANTGSGGGGGGYPTGGGGAGGKGLVIIRYLRTSQPT